MPGPKIQELATAAGVQLRAFRGPVDFPDMLRVANASSSADGVEIIRTLESITRDYAALRDSDPRHDVIIAEQAGEMVASARSMQWTQHDGLMLLGFDKRIGEDFGDARKRAFSSGSVGHWCHA